MKPSNWLTSKNPQFNPEREVVLAQPISQLADDSTNVNSVRRIEWLSKRTNDFELNVTAGEAGILVISQIDYPGWKARVDGRTAEIVRANYALPAIPIPQGEHRVTLSFEPLSFRVG